MKRRYYVKIEMEVHAITCPGVWLCTSGYIEVTIKTLNYFFRTGPLKPRFPMLCHDIFVIEGYFRSVSMLEELENNMNMEDIEICLWQNGRRLAYFNGKLGQLLSKSFLNGRAHNLNIQILLKPSHSFPGIIAPKLELTTRALAEIYNPFKDEINGRHVCYNPTRYVIPKARFTREIFVNQENYDGDMRRQKPVCHIKHYQESGSSSTATSNSRATSISWSTNSISSKKSSESKDSGKVSVNSDSFQSSTSGSSDSSGSGLSSGSGYNFSKRIKNKSRDNILEFSKDILDMQHIKTAEHLKKCKICKSYEEVFGS